MNKSDAKNPTVFRKSIVGFSFMIKNGVRQEIIFSYKIVDKIREYHI